MSHHYEARSIDASADKASLSTKKSQATSNESFIGNAREAMRIAAAAAAADDSDEECTSLAALKRAHLNEALASHEETQRLQRMCRYLKVSHKKNCMRELPRQLKEKNTFCEKKT